jgi:hypothetical protein
VKPLPLLPAAILSAFLIAPAAAQEKKNTETKPAKAAVSRQIDDEILRVNAEFLRSLTEYKEMLVKLQKIYERDVAKLSAQFESRAPLVAKGYISKKDLEEIRLAMESARAKVEETRRDIAQSEIAIAEAEGRRQLAALPALASGGYSESGSLIRFNGVARWSLAEAGKIEKFFASHFGHTLPVSARGQTQLHNMMRLDHSNAMDVPVHPDSPEGRALIAYLRESGVPFVAFRGRVSGTSTGAHIHIGKSSGRLVTPRDGANLRSIEARLPDGAGPAR